MAFKERRYLWDGQSKIVRTAFAAAEQFAVGVSYTYGKKIVKKYNELGEESVKNIKNKTRQELGGKKPLLREEQQDKLKKEVEIRPSDGGIWTGPKVARWIEKETGVKKVWNQRG